MNFQLAFLVSLIFSICSGSESNEDLLEETTTTNSKIVDTSVNEVSNNNSKEWTRKLIPPYNIVRTMASPTQVSSSSSFSWSNAIKNNPSTSTAYEVSFRNEVPLKSNNTSSLLPSLQQQAYALYLERVRRKKTMYPYGIMRWDNRGQMQMQGNYFPLQRQFQQQEQPLLQPQVLLPPPPSPPPSSSTSAQFSMIKSGYNNSHFEYESTSHSQNSVTAGVKVEDVTRDPLESGYELLLYNRFQELCLQIRGYRCDSGKHK